MFLSKYVAASGCTESAGKWIVYDFTRLTGLAFVPTLRLTDMHSRDWSLLQGFPEAFTAPRIILPPSDISTLLRLRPSFPNFITAFCFGGITGTCIPPLQMLVIPAWRCSDGIWNVWVGSAVVSMRCPKTDPSQHVTGEDRGKANKLVIQTSKYINKVGCRRFHVAACTVHIYNSITQCYRLSNRTYMQNKVKTIGYKY